MPTFGSASPNGAPVQFTISYDGTTQDWGSSRLMSLSNFSNESDSVENTYKLNSLGCELIDTDGVVWAALGGGTNCLRKNMTVVAHVGGTTSTTAGFDGVRLPYTFGTQGAYTATVFAGKVTSVARSNRVVKMQGENLLRQLSKMKWQPPVADDAWPFSRIGSFLFNSSDSFTGSLFNKYNVSPEGDEWECVGYDTTGLAGNAGDIYPGDNSRAVGTDWYASHNQVLGTQFYLDYSRIKFRGSYLGTYEGTITETVRANSLGFWTVAEAEAAIVRGAQGTYYPIHKNRLTYTGTSVIGTDFNFEGTFRLGGNPGTIYEWLAASRIVEPFFSGTDINSAVLDFSKQVLPSTYVERTFLPDDDSPFEAMKDLFQSTQTLFNVNNSNLMEFRVFGPVDLSVTPDEIAAGDVVDATVTNQVYDFTNRVVYRYDYDHVAETYGKEIELRGDNWSRPTDEVQEVESKWVHSPIEAQIFADRLMSRFLNSRPKIQLTTSLKNIKYNIGTVLTLNDPDSFGTGKLAVVTGQTLNFDDNTLTLTAEDGDALYRQRGYARFDSIGGTVTGTSKSGWSASGTVTNINTTKYGTVFRWF